VPSYEWKCMANSCHHEMTKIVPHDKYREPPEKCEKCGNEDPEQWEKFIGGAPSVNKSLQWRLKPGGKGNP